MASAAAHSAQLEGCANGTDLPRVGRIRGHRPVSRVLLVVEAIRDGVYNQVRNLVRQFHAQRPEATLDLCYSSAHAAAELPVLLEQITARGGEVMDLEVGRAPSFSDFRALGRLIRFARRTKPDLIHAHSSKAGGLARLAALLASDVPNVLYSPHAYFGMAPRGATGHAFNLAERLLAPLALSTACSSDEREFALRTLGIPPRQVVRLNHGIDLSRFCPSTLDERESLRRELGLPVDRLLLISVGRSSFQKNYEPLYSALARLSRLEGVHFAFAHAGKGSAALASQLPPDARKAVFTFEYLSNSAALVRAADGFILTSRFEGLSIAAIEALACGVQTILTRVPGSACLAHMNFPEIRWVQPSEQPGVLEDRLLEVLRSLNHRRPGPANTVQAKRTDELFNESRQFGKLFRVYDHLAASAANRH